MTDVEKMTLEELCELFVKIEKLAKPQVEESDVAKLFGELSGCAQEAGEIVAEILDNPRLIRKATWVPE